MCKEEGRGEQGEQERRSNTLLTDWHNSQLKQHPAAPITP